MGAEIYNGIHTLNDAFEECINLKDKFDKFNEFPRKFRKEKHSLVKTSKKFLKGGKEFLMLLKVKCFQ